MVGLTVIEATFIEATQLRDWFIHDLIMIDLFMILWNIFQRTIFLFETFDTFISYILTFHIFEFSNFYKCWTNIFNNSSNIRKLVMQIIVLKNTINVHLLKEINLLVRKVRKIISVECLKTIKLQIIVVKRICIFDFSKCRCINCNDCK